MQFARKVHCGTTGFAPQKPNTRDAENLASQEEAIGELNLKGTESDSELRAPHHTGTACKAAPSNKKRGVIPTSGMTLLRYVNYTIKCNTLEKANYTVFRKRCRTFICKHLHITTLRPANNICYIRHQCIYVCVFPLVWIQFIATYSQHFSSRKSFYKIRLQSRLRTPPYRSG